MTGRYPSFHSAGSYNGGYKVVADEVTLAERFRDAGYGTAAVVSNPVLTHRLGLDQGFDVYDDELERTERNRETGERRADRAVDLAIDLVRGFGDRPYFLWLHLQDPHGPYTPPAGWSPPWDGEDGGNTAFAGHRQRPEDSLELPLGENHSGKNAIPRYQILGEERSYHVYVDRYDAEISYMDAQLGRFLDLLDSRGVPDRGLVAITADHGEALGEDGFYFSHCNSVGPDQVHVPLIIVGRDVPARHVEGATVSNVSLFSTFLEFAGMPSDPALPSSVRVSLDERVAPPSLLPYLDQTVATPPLPLESLNQIGVTREGMVLRWDRVPADDRKFWSAGNPNTHSPWSPLGESFEGLTDAPPAASAPGRSSLEEALTRFERAAAAGRQQLEPLRQTTRLPKGLEDMLRAIGYIQ